MAREGRKEDEGGEEEKVRGDVKVVIVERQGRGEYRGRGKGALKSSENTLAGRA